MVPDWNDETVQSTKKTNKLEEKQKLINVVASLTVLCINLQHIDIRFRSAEYLNSESENLEFSEISHFVKMTTTNEFLNPKYSEMNTIRKTL